MSVSIPYRGATFLNGCLRNPTSFSTCFHPLSGSYISQWHTGNCHVRFIRFMVSIPYRGATFLNQTNQNCLEMSNVSIPYRGATFLNTISANPPPVWCKYGNCVAKIIFAKCSCFWKYKSLQESVFKPCVAKS